MVIYYNKNLKGYKLNIKLKNMGKVVKIDDLQRVKVEDIGLYIKVIRKDYSPTTNKELARLITEHFKIDCKVMDISHYEGLCMSQIEDYERASREVEYNINPFEKYK